MFTTIPTTQYVWINQNVRFECATNITGYHLQYSIVPSVTKKEILASLPGGGELLTVIFTVTSDNNGSTVRCYAETDTKPLPETPIVHAYAQGICTVQIQYIVHHSAYTLYASLLN